MPALAVVALNAMAVDPSALTDEYVVSDYALVAARPDSALVLSLPDRWETVKCPDRKLDVTMAENDH